MKKVIADLNAADEIIRVMGHCKTHGEIETNDWEYWDFFSGQEEPTPPLKENE